MFAPKDKRQNSPNDSVPLHVRRVPSADKLVRILPTGHLQIPTPLHIESADNHDSIMMGGSVYEMTYCLNKNLSV